MKKQDFFRGVVDGPVVMPKSTDPIQDIIFWLKFRDNEQVIFCRVAYPAPSEVISRVKPGDYLEVYGKVIRAKYVSENGITFGALEMRVASVSTAGR